LKPKPAFIYRHVVSFEETNVVGNVYYTRHISWQGRCREMFLKQHAPEILHDIARDLRLVTLRMSCEYFEELNAFDEIEIQMRLAHLRQHRIGLEANRRPGGGYAPPGDFKNSLACG
jgi:enediyne biosynthesis thioesterase